MSSASSRATSATSSSSSTAPHSTATKPPPPPPTVPSDAPSSNDPSIPIIAVTAVIGGLIVLGVVARLIYVLHKRRTQRSRPLPPARPLSMVQQQDPSWNGGGGTGVSMNRNSTFFAGSRPSFSGYHSSDPLLSATRPSFGKESSRESSPMRQPGTPETPDFNDGQPLAPPNPAFFSNNNNNSSNGNSPVGSLSGASSRTNSFTSIASASANSDSDNGGGVSATYNRPPRPNSVADFSPPRVNSNSHSSRQRHSLVVSGSTNSPSRNSYYRSPRPVSSASLSSIRSGEAALALGRRSIPTIRGAPHRPHSRVEIILPMPLAPQLSPYSGGSGSGDDRDSLFTREASSPDGFGNGMGSRRQSMVSISDPWMVAGREASSSSTKAEKSRRRQSRTSDSDHRPASQSRLSRPSSSSASSHGGESSSLSSTVLFTSASSPSPGAQAPPPPMKTHADRLRIPQVPQIPQRLVTSPTAQSPLSSELASMEDETLESSDTKPSSVGAEKTAEVLPTQEIARPADASDDKQAANSDAKEEGAS